MGTTSRCCWTGWRRRFRCPTRAPPNPAAAAISDPHRSRFGGAGRRGCTCRCSPTATFSASTWLVFCINLVGLLCQLGYSSVSTGLTRISFGAGKPSPRKAERLTSLQVKSSDGREVYHLKMWSNETIGAVSSTQPRTPRHILPSAENGVVNSYARYCFTQAALADATKNSHSSAQKRRRGEGQG